MRATVVEQFKKYLETEKLDNGKISFNADLGVVDSKASIVFTERAFMKTMLYVEKCPGEVGWHGTVERVNDHCFKVTDVFLYPQTVSGATVDTDDNEMSKWIANLSDETFDHMRFQAHSHVNFTVHPSSVDMDYYSRMLQRVKDEDFYLFMIFNKKWEWSAQLYDLKTNTKYETGDVMLYIGTDNLVSHIDEELKEKVKTYQTNYCGNTVNTGNPDDSWHSWWDKPENDNAGLTATEAFNAERDPIRHPGMYWDKELQRYVPVGQLAAPKINRRPGRPPKQNKGKNKGKGAK